MAVFQKAERRRAKLRLAITGPSGSGKTYSALLIAKGIGGRIAALDTENRSMELYAGNPEMPEFDVAVIEPPYTVEKYIAGIREALTAKYDILIIDSISHAWAGEGGLLQQKEDLDARGGKQDKNKFANWASITKKHEQFRAWLLKVDVHLIVTMRSKQEYVLGDGNKPIKVGMAPVQRDGMEYEFTSVLDIAHNHTAMASKDRTTLFSENKIFTPSEQTGRDLMAWLNSGAEGGVAPEITATPDAQMERPTHKQLARLHAIKQECHWKDADLLEYMRGMFGKSSTKDLNWMQYNEVCKYMQQFPKVPPAADPTPGPSGEAAATGPNTSVPPSTSQTSESSTKTGSNPNAGTTTTTDFAPSTEVPF